MSFESGTNYTESDADDEYDGHIAGSSPVADSEASPYDSEMPSSSEHTPTTYAHRSSGDRLPETVITDWTADDCATFLSTIGLHKYANTFIENEIMGDTLVALLHDDLKSMGITSVGHRLSILKSVYDVKKAQDVPIEDDHYIPLSIDEEAQYATATVKDIRILVDQLRQRDDRVSALEQDLYRITEDFRRLREDVLPALRLVKDAQQPLPNVNPPSYSFETTLSPSVNTPVGGQTLLSRTLSTKKFQPVMTPSPSHLQTTHDRSIDDSNGNERLVLSSNHLSTMSGGLTPSTSSPIYANTNIPSPTSPPVLQQTTLGARSYRAEPPSSTRSTFAESEYGHSSRSEKMQAPRRRETPAPDTPGASSGSSSQMEIFKSFRVSLEDPCYKVLPAALRKYQIHAPWEQYSLYIVYGDQERCLGLNEKPLILFKQLEKEGKKPMFMLRKTNAGSHDGPQDVPGSAGLNAAARGAAMGYDPPGGII
ncbi:hypothetical protein TD95_004271 [Thielaviopsis punctulata]|uniref:Uncharacterized protein n=1 Tax=Thielaviopsis punctulata TaxID=72032 RepID=A0A0F4ZCC6_9PEZI|nr:hypothetical protein TD95_004271 [Thielaviopsis punctulata]